MKRILCILLSIMLLLPTFSTGVWAGDAAYRKCADIPFSYNGVRTVDNNNEIFSYGVTFPTPIDLTAYGYPASGTIAAGKLALQMDICISGTAAVVKAMETHDVAGQIEITSGGTCDVNELSVAASALAWKANTWNRVIIDLSRFNRPFGGAFDPKNFNYMRMYIGNLARYFGDSAYVKFANVQVVDLTQPLGAENVPALGDGTAPDQVPPQSVTYDAPGYTEIAEIPYSHSVYTFASGEVYSSGSMFSAIDLTGYGYPQTGVIEAGKLGLQLDYYVEGGPNTTAILEGGTLGGQIEISSSGTCDVEELGMNPTRLKGKNGEWVRLILDLAWFTTPMGGSFDPTGFDYFRMYLSVPKDYPDERVEMRVCNLRLVDLTKPLTEEEAPSIGNGTFTPEAPVFKVQPQWAGYVTDTAVVAGYNLKSYAEQHDLMPVKDWTPVIQSLAYGLSKQGGGMLYIPAGVYPCYGEIILPSGVTLQGDWQTPDEDATVQGTVLAVYAGENRPNSSAFISMSDNSYLRSLAFWYPNQQPENPTNYPYTILMGSTTHVKDVTLVNSYNGITARGGSCPDIENVYGTPLSCGMDLDMISDSYGMENVNFAPDYWINSGLAGAPSSETAAAALREQLYYSATGMVIRRMDWSWTTYSTFKGYSVGIHFAQSAGGVYPNGQCYNITLEDCYTALQVDGIGGAGMVMNGLYIKNCEYGVFFAGNSRLYLIDADISANSAVVVQGPMAKLSLLSSLIRRGTVVTKGGWLTVLDTKFQTAAPHITLDSGTQSALLAAATDAWGERAEVKNKAYCLFVQEDSNPMTEQMPVISREQGLYQHHRPASSAVTVADLDNTGKTDVSAALNALLQEQAKTGGTVFVKPGFYRIDNAVTVPTGVELLGSLDFGQAELFNGVGTIFQIYHGKNQPDAATFILEAGAGLRGVQINYPEQNIQPDGNFVPYAHTVQGRGAGAYVINVSSRNSWSGVDFMTYRCDNHYIDSFRGNALVSYVAVGGGAENGVVRNCHLQYTSWTYGDHGSRGGWPRVVEDPSDEAREAWRMDLYIFSGHHLNNYTIGHVTNQLHFGNMNYCGYTGINVVPEKTGLADVTVWGQNTDCCTISMNVEAAKRVDFISLQTTAFTWIAERQEKEMNLIHLGKDCDITVNVFGAALYENPDYMFDVENGTLNIYGAVYMSSVPMANISKNGKVNLVDMYLGTYDSAFDDLVPPAEIPSAVTNPQNLSISYSFYTKPVQSSETIGQYKHVYEAINNFRLDVSENMQIPKDAELVFSEGFTDYGSLEDSMQKVKVLLSGKGGSVTPRRGNMQITHAKDTFMAALSAAQQFAVSEGVYRFETRFNLESLRETDGSRFAFALYNEKGVTLPLVRFEKSGKVEVKRTDGWKEIGTFSTGTWYRLGVVADMNAHTFAVYLMNDDYQTLAASGLQDLAVTALTGMWVYAEAETGNEGTKTVAQVDYLAVLKTAESYGLLGDVNGNGAVNSTDARLVLQYTVKKIDQTKLNLAAADVDGNGRVDSTDARLILQFTVGKIKTFPNS